MKPILFNTEMVGAILDGRKTVTRRVVKPQPKMQLSYICMGSNNGTWTYPPQNCVEQSGWDEKYRRIDGLTAEDCNRHWTPPYHADDILYVREPWVRFDCCWCEGDYSGQCLKSPDEKDGCFMYRATDEIWGDAKWRPSIHMPKEAARLFLRVTNVRVERLQDIDYKDCKAEGIWDDYKTCSEEYHENLARMAYPRCFSELWDSTIKKADLPRYGWASNPWVWVIEFERANKE